MRDRRWLIGEDGLSLMLNFCIENVEIFTRNYLNFNLTTKDMKHRLDLSNQEQSVGNYPWKGGITKSADKQQRRSMKPKASPLEKCDYSVYRTMRGERKISV